MTMDYSLADLSSLLPDYTPVAGIMINILFSPTVLFQIKKRSPIKNDNNPASIVDNSGFKLTNDTIALGLHYRMVSTFSRGFVPKLRKISE